MNVLNFYQWWKFLDQLRACTRSWTISVNEGIQDPENWTQYSSFVSALFAVIHNKLQYTWSGDNCECVQPAQLIVSVCGLSNLLWVCAACPTYCECVRPAQLRVLTWGSSSVPPAPTSTIRSPPGPRRIQQNFMKIYPVKAKLFHVRGRTCLKYYCVGAECLWRWRKETIPMWGTEGPYTRA
jgi:hypothetical protein